MVLVQVYVSVYADGPTRVLRFADEKSTALLEAEQSVLDLAARLKQAGFLHRLHPDTHASPGMGALLMHLLMFLFLACLGNLDWPM